jgi:hypothetical protein
MRDEPQEPQERERVLRCLGTGGGISRMANGDIRAGLYCTGEDIGIVLLIPKEYRLEFAGDMRWLAGEVERGVL